MAHFHRTSVLRSRGGSLMARSHMRRCDASAAIAANARAACRRAAAPSRRCHVLPYARCSCADSAAASARRECARTAHTRQLAWTVDQCDRHGNNRWGERGANLRSASKAPSRAIVSRIFGPRSEAGSQCLGRFCEYLAVGGEHRAPHCRIGGRDAREVPEAPGGERKRSRAVGCQLEKRGGEDLGQMTHNGDGDIVLSCRHSNWSGTKGFDEAGEDVEIEIRSAVGREHPRGTSKERRTCRAGTAPLAPGHGVAPDEPIEV